METIDLMIYNVDTEPLTTVQYFLLCQDKHTALTVLCNVINSQSEQGRAIATQFSILNPLLRVK